MTSTWVVGSGGLLGRHVVRSLRARGDAVLTREIPWYDEEQSGPALDQGVAALGAAAGADPWAVAWCAGAGIVATPREHLEAEVRIFEAFLQRLETLGSMGSLFLASSAGGVYAGSVASPPFTEDSPTAALAPYGEAKLAMEALASAYAQRSGARVFIGRISNLYGPGQNLSKPQGLVSLLCQAQISRQPVGVYVSMDTLRDYLYVEDAAAMVVAGLQQLAQGEPGVVVKILASGRGTSIAALVGEATKVFRRKPPIVFRVSATSAVQVRDLRVSSLVWPELDRLARTPLPVGLAATGQSIKRAMASVRV
ncbi:MAG TPA: NAD-dependent epimerase/dehydratase family protein [Nocardioidaceae bacterium]|nr:NAD-dependent epimerase/dehydratase family protein [Nocardioidaceae bacterium]